MQKKKKEVPATMTKHAGRAAEKRSDVSRPTVETPL